MGQQDLPFKEGQLVEARSFLQGYRGAWFRCKIVDMRRRDSKMQYALQYFDFPDEKLKWTKLYQYPNHRPKNTGRELMVRPCFPSVYCESQLPEIKTISEVVVVVNDVWKVGDFVDWWTDGCYWSGTLTEALGSEKFQIELLPPPAGEGSLYEASCKDFRPSLSWSPKHGWTVPIPLGIEDYNPCARLIKPMSQGHSANLAVPSVDDGRKEPEATVRASFELNASFSSHITANSLPPPHRSDQIAERPFKLAGSDERHTPGRRIHIDIANGGLGKTSCSDSVSSSKIRGASAEMAGNTGAKDSDDNDGHLKKTEANGGTYLNIKRSDTIEAAILDLEELVKRVKWIRGMLESGTPSSNTAGPIWKFLEHDAKSKPK